MTHRITGEKRDLDAARSTDGGLGGDGSHTTIVTVPVMPPTKKRRITHQVPAQCDEEGHFHVVLGEDIDAQTGRYKILSYLGEGTFGKVVQAWDRKHKVRCAVKIVRNLEKYTADALREIDWMEQVKRADPNDVFCLIKITSQFSVKGVESDDAAMKHACIAMPSYGPTLLSFMHKRCANGFGNNHRVLASIAFQVGLALDFLHTEMRVMHTDLKPENMLLESGKVVMSKTDSDQISPDSDRIRICDFGGFCNEGHEPLGIVTTQYYRSPEVLLGMGWMYPTDMWSMGCILYELFTGRILFDTDDVHQHLHLMQKRLGVPVPAQEWAAECGFPLVKADVFHTSAGPGNSPHSTVSVLKDLPSGKQKESQQVERCRPMVDKMLDRAVLVQSPSLKIISSAEGGAKAASEESAENLRSAERLTRLIEGLLDYNQDRRMSAAQMATNDYVSIHYPEAQGHPLWNQVLAKAQRQKQMQKGDR